MIILVAGAIVVINYATNWFDIIKEEWNTTTQVEQPATERVVENPENKLNQPKQNAPAKIVSTKNNDIAAAAKNLEEIFEKSDVNALQALLTETSLPEYKSILTNIQPYMPEYAKAFKSRKLVHSTPVFAQYAFSDEKGNKFTVEFALTGSGMWKLVRF